VYELTASSTKTDLQKRIFDGKVIIPAKSTLRKLN